MAGRMRMPAILVDALHARGDLSLKQRELLVERKGSDALPVSSICRTSPRRSRGAERRAANHDGVDAKGVERVDRLLRCADIAAADYGNLHAWVGAKFADKSPVGLTGVHL